VRIETRNSGNTYLMRFLGFIVAIVPIVVITNTIVVDEIIVRASIVFVFEVTLEVIA
jgi:hypothetical protein